MNPEPESEHLWLQKLVGNWTYENEAVMAPGEAPTKFTGIEVVRSLGGLWTIGEGQWEGPGGGIHKSIMTLGYDPAKKRFVGTFIGSMMTNLWIYDGTFDPTGKFLILDSAGPNFTGDGMTRYQDLIEFIDDNHRILGSQIQQADGTWNRFMTAHYSRAK